MVQIKEINVPFLILSVDRIKVILYQFKMSQLSSKFKVRERYIEGGGGVLTYKNYSIAHKGC